jgi:hypothetical protein
MYSRTLVVVAGAALVDVTVTSTQLPSAGITTFGVELIKPREEAA